MFLTFVSLLTQDLNGPNTEFSIPPAVPSGVVARACNRTQKHYLCDMAFYGTHNIGEVSHHLLIGIVACHKSNRTTSHPHVCSYTYP